jgi:2-polyprenyl-3-methyl-5-hydroxy-6-metoxy-1,4-benzoquinol methylase
MPDLSTRSRQMELMDDESIGGPELARTLDELEVINRLLGGYTTSIRGVASLVSDRSRELSVLDVGTGCGDFPRRLSAWAGRRNIRLRVLGIDLSSSTVEHARHRSRGFEGLDFQNVDLFALPTRQHFDIVHAAMVLHHFDDERAPETLRRMHELSRRGLVVNDIHRHWIAYHSIRILTRLFSRSRLVRNDAPLSVLRAFRRSDLEELARTARLPSWRLSWHWAFRWSLVAPR